jgi:hypothetical protein
MKNNTKIRRGQALYTFGIGSVISTQDDESFIILNNSSWKYSRTNEHKHVIREPRLRSLLQVNGFKYPPEDKSLYLNGVYIPSSEYITSIRFPGCHYCRFCKEMYHIGPTQTDLSCQNNDCLVFNKFNTLISTRFMTVCSNGHIDDFPFIEWVHDGMHENDHKLKYGLRNWLSTTQAVEIRCKTCSKKRNMGNALLGGRLNGVRSCKGYRHWLFKGNLEDTREECVVEDTNTYKYQGIQKGSSNLYFPLTKSSIWVPEGHGFPTQLIDFVIQRDLKKLRRENPDEIFMILLNNLYDNNYNFTKEDVIRYLDHSASSSEDELSDYESLKFNEFSTYSIKPGIEGDDDYSARILDIDNYEDCISSYFESVTLIEKLRETRAFCGFTRLAPFADGSASGLREKIAELIQEDRTLPANIVRGEGIFVCFDQDRLSEWSSDPEVIQHLNRLISDEVSTSFESLAEFVLLHTFAHSLIKEISLECGYSAASIRERIYSNTIGRDKMYGVLVYTSEGDSEGSLGGLVRLGEPGRFEVIIRNLIHKSKWCSSDPVCSSIGLQGPSRQNIAACHNCCIIPETCCEYFNRFLDRNLQVDTFINMSISYFN